MTHRRRAWLSEALVVAGLLLLPLLFWWRLWAPNPANRAAIPEGDFTSQYYPLQLFAARQIAAGHLPAWDAYINAGQPGLADIQTGAFYPPNLLANLALALLGRPLTQGLLQAQVVFHFSLASLFIYLFVRRLARRARARLSAARFAGAAASLSFTYSGYLTSFPVQQLTILETAVWLPLVLLFQDLSLVSGGAGPRRWGFAILAGMALATALLAGHPQTAMFVVYAALAYSLFLLLTTDRPSSQASASGRSRFAHWALRLAPCALPFLVAFALAAVQIVPTLTFIARSSRAGLTYEEAAQGFSLHEIAALLYPGYFGGSPQYVGILTPILAGAAWFMKRARREVVFWTVLGAMAFLLAFGGDLFLYDVAYLLAPGFSAVRDQERTIYLFSLAVSVLAGYGALVLVQPLPGGLRHPFRQFSRFLLWTLVAFLGLTALWFYGFEQALQNGVQVNLFAGLLRHHALLLLILGGSVLLFALRRAGRVRRRWLVVLALALIWLNLFTVNGRYNVAAPVEGGSFPKSGLVEFLKSRPGTFRISSAGLLPGGSGAGIVYTLEDITANTPLRLEAFRQFEERVGSWTLWQLLNVEYVLTEAALDSPAYERVYQEGRATVYRLSDPLPRAWVVYGTVGVGDGEVLDRLNSQGFDPRRVAIVSPADQEALGLPGPGRLSTAAEVVESSPGRLSLRLTADAGGLLVVSQPYYPGWQARLDGERVSLHRANYLLQGIAVPAGSHLVDLTYRLPLWPGVLTLATLLACLAGLIFTRLGR